MTVSSTFLASTYFLLIVLFYEQTDGFGTEHVLKYTVLKTVPILLLATYVHLGFANMCERAKRSHTIGLLFGACGDFLISFQNGGLVLPALLFAGGHLMYMSDFALRLKKLSRELVMLTLTYALFVNHFFFMPQLMSHPLSTLIIMSYSMILCAALVISGSLYFHGSNTQAEKHPTNLVRFLGYALFFFSDSLLLVEHCGYNFPHVSFFVLSTYYASQYCLLWSAMEADKLIPDSHIHPTAADTTVIANGGASSPVQVDVNNNKVTTVKAE